MAGRSKKTAESLAGHRSKKELQARKEMQNKLKGNSNKIFCPSWLDDTAREEFQRVATELKELDLISNIDVTVLAIYCDAYSNYVQLTQAIQTNGAIQYYTNTKGEENKVVSAEVMAQNKYIDTIMKCSSKMGLSISDRLKLVIPDNDTGKENKFVKFCR